MKKIIFILLVIVALVVFLPLSFNNADSVSFDYIFGKYQLPLSWLMFGSFIVGVLVALPFFAITGLGWKLKARSLQKQVTELIRKRERDEIAEQFKAEKES